MCISAVAPIIYDRQALLCNALDPAAFKGVAEMGSAVVFATGQERGAGKVWRSDNGQCILEQRCPSPQILDVEAWTYSG